MCVFWGRRCRAGSRAGAGVSKRERRVGEPRARAAAGHCTHGSAAAATAMHTLGGHVGHALTVRSRVGGGGRVVVGGGRRSFFASEAGLPAHGCPLAARCWVQGCSARPALGCSTAGRVPGQFARLCCRGRAGLGQRAGHVARAPRRGVGALGCGSLVCLEGPSARMETPFHLVRAAVLPCHPHRRRRTGLSQGSPAGNCVTGWSERLR